MLAVRLRSWPLTLLAVAALASCGDPYGPAQPRGEGKAGEGKVAPAEGKSVDGKSVDGKAADGKTADAKAGANKPPALPTSHADGKPLARVFDDAPLPLTKMLGQSPPEVEKFLGPPLPNQKGGMRDSCVRYIPERTWFRCKFAWQRYADKTGNFEAVHVTYEDGKASGVAFEKIPGTGPFEPKKALRTVGLELPGAAKIETPDEGVTVWSWFNSAARLAVHGRQYRVRVSTVGGKWETAKVEIILNDALNDSEKARVFEPGGAGDEPAGE